MDVNVTEAAAEAAAEAAEEAAAVADAADSLGPGYQLGFLLLASLASVPPIRLARELLAARRPLSAVDETLLARVLLTSVSTPLCNGCLLLVTRVWQTPAALRTGVCHLYSLVIMDSIGLVTVANCVISLCRLQQLLVASRWPALAQRLTQRRLRWQNRLLLIATLATFSALPSLGLQPSTFFWCAGLPLPLHRPPVMVLFAINSCFNIITFVASMFLLRASSGLADTHWPRNYVPAHSWAQLCLVIVTASHLLVPVNTSQLASQPRIFLNHAVVTLIYGVLDPCMLLGMASRWRQQVRQRRQQRAQQPEGPRRGQMVIPVIRLDLI